MHPLKKKQTKKQKQQHNTKHLVNGIGRDVFFPFFLVINILLILPRPPPHVIFTLEHRYQRKFPPAVIEITHSNEEEAIWVK